MVRAGCSGLAVALVLCAQPVGAAEREVVMFLLGGVVSGPYRASADLEAGVASEAKPPPGKRGDGAGLDAAVMPATSTRALRPAAAARIRALAATVWDSGADLPGICPPSIDALWRFRIVRAGEARVFDVSAACANPGAHALQQALVCEVRSNGPGCPGE